MANRTILVYDGNFNLLCHLDDYSLVMHENYYEHDTMVLTIPSSSYAATYAIPQQDGNTINKIDQRILVFQDNLKKGFIVENFEVDEFKSRTITLYCFGLSSMIGWRTVIEQMQFEDENLFHSADILVERNAVLSFVGPLRQIQGLVTYTKDTSITTDELVERLKPLDLSVRDMLADHECAYEIELNIDEEEFGFYCYQGTDRSASQSVNEKIIMRVETEAVTNTVFSKDRNTMKNVCLVEADDKDGNKIVQWSDGHVAKIGWNRREVGYYDSMLSQMWTSGAIEYVLATVKYEQYMRKSGKKYLYDYKTQTNMSATISPNSQYVLNRDFYLGDKITIDNENLGISMDSRIIQVRTTIDNNGERVEIEIGDNKLGFMKKMRRVIQNGI